MGSIMLFLEILFVLLLTLTNALLAMSELAIVSARRSRLQHMARSGDQRARVALRLIDDPGRFLATVQVGITLVGVLAGAFGGTTIAGHFGSWLDGFAAIAPYGHVLAVGIVVLAITYLSIVVGELVPKRVALANPERVAAAVARLMSLLSRLARPLVWLLKKSTDAFLVPLGFSRMRETTVTEDEVKGLIAEGTRAGIFMPQEREMIEGVLRLADRAVRIIMTPRTEIVWLGIDADRDTISRAVSERRFSCLLVCDGAVDHVVGTAHAKDLLPLALKGEPIDLKTAMAPVLIVPETTPVLMLLNQFRRERIHVAAVVDEYGVTEGIVTLTDVLEAIAGEFPERGEAFEPLIVQRQDGTWLVDGMLPLDELEDRLQLPGLRKATPADTVAGFVLHRLAHLPKSGESFLYGNTRFEVADMDGLRIDKVLISRPGVDQRPDGAAGPA